MNTAMRDYIFFNSPLKTQKGKIALAVFLIAIAIPALLGLGAEEPRLLIRSFLWMPYSILGSVLTYLIVSFFDRKRAFRAIQFSVIAFVTFFSAFAALYFNKISPSRLVTVGFVEEFFKITPVIILAIFFPAIIRTKKDGIVYGAMAGIGFNVIEIGFYIAEATAGGETVLGALYSHSTRLAIFGFGSHIIWSAFAGLGIGWAVQSSKTGLRKWLPAVICYLAVAIAHSAYDLGLMMIAILPLFYILSLIRGEAEPKLVPNAPGPFRDAMVFEHFIYNIIFIVIMLNHLVKSLRFEQTIYIEQLSSESEAVVGKDELALLKQENSISLRKYRNYPRGIAGQIVKYQNRLAVLKHTVVTQGMQVDQVGEVESLRKHILALKKSA